MCILSMAALEFSIKFLSGFLSLPLYSALLVVALFVILYRLVENRLLLAEVQVLPPSEGNLMESTDSFRPVVESDGQDAIPQVRGESTQDYSRIEDSIETAMPSIEENPSVFTAATKGPLEDILQSIQPLSSTHVQESTKPTESETRDGVRGIRGDCRSPNYFQVVFLGDSGVGKTSFMRKYCASSFEEILPSTVCIDLMTKKTSVGGLPVILHLWDTAGQERFRSISTQYLRKADCIVTMYDMSREDTLTNVRHWLTSAEDLLGSSERIVLGVVANKSDLLRCAQTSRRMEGSKNSPSIEDVGDDEDEDDDDDDDDDLFRYMCIVEGKVLAENLQAAFGICSSKTGRGISKFMKTVCRMLMERWNRSSVGKPVTPGTPEGVVKVESKGRLEKMKNFECC